MNLAELIHSSEKKFIKLLEAFFENNYDDRRQISHGIDHHRRVWNYAKELLQFTISEEKKAGPLFIDKLLIACFLHDIGMAIDPGERHGRHSRKLCEQFLSENDLDKSDYKDVLEAIENHDNKEYADSPANDRLLLLLSVSDDLDAFGYIGIYRYLEIYLARGIQPENIGYLVRENAKKRFMNFEINFNDYPALVEKHRERCLILENFFDNLNSEFRPFPKKI
jgi:HD superfamily phosphodiesterase